MHKMNLKLSCTTHTQIEHLENEIIMQSQLFEKEDSNLEQFTANCH